jgi:hypothetical protein
MADNLNSAGNDNEAIINVDEQHDLQTWTNELDVAEEKLRQAIAAVGPLVKDVKRYLQK